MWQLNKWQLVAASTQTPSFQKAEDRFFENLIPGNVFYIPDFIRHDSCFAFANILFLIITNVQIVTIRMANQTVHL